MEFVQAISLGGRKLGRVPLEQAHEMIRLKEARGDGTKRRIRVLIVYGATVSRELPGGTPNTYYSDDLGNGHHVGTMKRHTPSGWRKWDPNLTFAEARRGRILSEKTVMERLEARTLRRTA